MKKTLILILSALFALGLTSCGEGRDVTAVHTPSINGAIYTVNTEDCTVSDGEHTYSYEYMEFSDGYRISVNYPDGSSWYRQEHGDSVQSGQSESYGPGEYAPGEKIYALILDSLQDVSPAHSVSGWRIFLVVMLLCSGAVGLFAPQAVWQLKCGWRFKEAEPSGAALFVNRAIGAVCLIAGLLLLLL